MTDNKNIRDKRESSKVAAGEVHEVDVLKRHFPKASDTQLKQAIKDGKNNRQKTYTLLDKYR
ncbi:MAG TPA: hypothetical protein VHE77_21050 [Dongiaceae bacterium]|jgi:hypothetical protein|nr:hypothetical protein [Dongiaceae bacterium]